MADVTVGRYKLIGKLGQGGMASVYLAHDPRINRQVAIKVLANHLAENEKIRARFSREAQAVAVLEHPAIVPIYDFGDDNGRLFLVMRYMQGGTLGDKLKQGTLSQPEILKIIQRIAAALDSAHRQNIVHRDLKPANILFDRYGEAYLSDFGIARIAKATVALTQNDIIGTPAYMSPEQAQGGITVDGRTDIYALGIILFEMLTGRPPYSGDTPVQLLMQHILQPIPNIRQANAALPPAMETVINHALAKERDDRFQTAGALANSLVASTGAQAVPPQFATKSGDTLILPKAVEMPAKKTPPVKPKPVPPPAKAVAPSRKKPPLLGIGLGVIFLLLLAATGYFFINRESKTEGQGVVEALTASPTAPTNPVPTATVLPATEATLPTATQPIATATIEPTPLPEIIPLTGDVLVWHMFNQAFISSEGVKNAFQLENPEVNLEFRFIERNELQDAFQQAVNNGQGPTILLGTLEWAAPLYDNGYVQDLTGLIAADTLAAVDHNTLGNLEYEGVLIGIPYARKGIVLLRNKIIAPNPFASFDGVQALGETYNLERGFYYSAATLNAVGGTLFDVDGNPTFNSDAGIAWLQRLNQFNDPQNYGDDDIALFINGQVGLIMDGTWNISRLAEAIGPENLAIDPWPEGLSGWALSDVAFISRNTSAANMPANIAFIEHLLSPKVQRSLIAISDLPVTNIPINAPLVAQAKTALDSGSLFPVHVALDAYWQPLTTAIEQAYQGTPPQTVLGIAQTQVEAELAK